MTKFLDLDAVAEATKYTFKLDGEIHELKLTTVDDFIENTKLIESLGTTATMTEEFNVIVKILDRVLPTVGEKRLRQLTLPQLRMLNEWARSAGGEDATKANSDDAPASGAATEGNAAAS